MVLCTARTKSVNTAASMCALSCSYKDSNHFALVYDFLSQTIAGNVSSDVGGVVTKQGQQLWKKNSAFFYIILRDLDRSKNIAGIHLGEAAGVKAVRPKTPRRLLPVTCSCSRGVCYGLR